MIFFALLYVDVATRFTIYSRNCEQGLGNCVGWCRACVVKHYGLPEQIATDSGGEFSANRFAYLCADADIRPALKPKGSHAFFSGSRIHAAKAVSECRWVDFPDMSNEHLSHPMTRRINEMLNGDGISAGQVALGRSPQDIAPSRLMIRSTFGLQRQIRVAETLLAAERIRAMTLEITHNEIARSKLRRLLRPQNACKGAEVRQGGCAPFFCQPAKRSSRRWRFPAEVVDVERDAVSVTRQGGIRKVSHN